MNSASSSKRTQEAYIAQLGYMEKLVVPAKVATVLAHAFASLLTGMLRSKDAKPPKLFQYFAYTAYRTLARITTVGQMQMTQKPTDDVYAAACKQHNMTPNSVVLEDGTRAHWIGPSSANKIILNFHGGGYVLPAGPAWVEFMFQVQSFLAKEKNEEVAVLFLSYDLSPAVHYPRQLQQAAALLSHVLHVLHKEPQNIIVTGDSAGGNLATALLSHISHPHPGFVNGKPILPISMVAPFRAVVLMSPWVDFRLNTESMKRNIYKDCIDIQGGGQWADAFMGTKKQGDPANTGGTGKSDVDEKYPNADFYNQAIAAPVSWWEGVKAEEIIIVAGKDEVLVDGIAEFGETLKNVESLKGKVTLVITDGEAHDQPYMDIALGYKTDGEQAKAVKGFLSSRL